MDFKYANSQVERDRIAVIETLREKESYYKNIADTLPAAVYCCDSWGTITYFNKAAEDLWGRAPLIGKDLWCGSWKIYNTSGERMMLDSCPMAIALKEGRPVRGVEIIIEKPDGERRNILPHPQPIFDAEGRVTGAMNMLIDITELKQTQQALKIIEEKKNNLYQTNSSLKHINQDLEQFAYITSHDLQEPVRKIQVFAERVRERNRPTLDAESNKFIDKIILAAGRMKSLITEVLDYSRLAHSEEKFVKADLNEIFSRVLEDLELKIEQKGAAIHKDNLPVSEVIPTQIAQMFYNLLSNSLKYVQENVRPVIRISSAVLPDEKTSALALNPNKSYFQITFRDNGIGFRKEFMNAIFSPFKRSEDVTEFEGTGLGLAICKKIARDHQGMITANSVVGSGTEINVILPLHQ